MRADMMSSARNVFQSKLPSDGTAVKKFGPEIVRYDRYPEKGGVSEFPVYTKDKGIVSSTSLSSVLGSLPLASCDHVFVRGDLLAEAREWLKENRLSVIQPEAKESL